MNFSTAKIFIQLHNNQRLKILFQYLKKSFSVFYFYFMFVVFVVVVFENKNKLKNENSIIEEFKLN